MSKIIKDTYFKIIAINSGKTHKEQTADCLHFASFLIERPNSSNMKYIRCAFIYYSNH